MLNPEIYLLKAFLLKPETYHEYRSYINLEKIEIRELVILFKLLDKLYNDGHTCSIDDFIVLAKAEHSGDIFNALIDSIARTDITEFVLGQVLNTYKQRSLAKDIALEALAVTEGRGSIDRLSELSNALKTDPVVEEERNEFVIDDLAELHSGTVAKPGLRWRLKSLNEMLGSLRKGDFGFIFARPETGKTTFLASEVTFFATQTEQPILWFNNEEQGSKVASRCYQAALGVTTQELYSNIEQNQQLYRNLVSNRIRIYDSAAVHRKDVERLCKQFNPSLVLFDQIDKIKGFDGDREDLRLGSIYIWAREIAKEHCPVIGVTQADGSGEGKRWLTMENVANAKTAKQAEADWILGIGKSHDEGLEYIRHLHLSKNKLTGDSDSIPELRHGKKDVVINPNIARYQDI